MSAPDPDSVKMFVGQIPFTMEEDELKRTMEEFGPVYQLGIIRDRASGQHRGKYLIVTDSSHCSQFTVCGDAWPLSCVSAEACLTGWPNA